MAQKRKNPKPPASNPSDEPNRLPQNIVNIGERVEENKNIYISQKTYKAVHRFAQGKTDNESGGILVGDVIEEFGKTNIVIDGFIEARHCEATPNTLKFTHETWAQCHKELAKKHPGKKIVGWIHTHPDFGIFLSEYDKFIHENFFKEDHQIAYVVDPIQDSEGFYFWINGRLERCKGFYIFDKTGSKIDVHVGADNGARADSGGRLLSAQSVLLGGLVLAVILLLISNMTMSARLAKLQNQQEALDQNAYQGLLAMQQQISVLQYQIDVLTTAQNESAASSETADGGGETEDGLKTGANEESTP